MSHQVSAILLAAGSGRRMGAIKQLLPLGHKPVIRHCAESIISAGIMDIIVVTGQEHVNIKKALNDLPVRFAHNSHEGSEMAESVRTGLREVDVASTGILICLSDHPLVSPCTFQALVQVHSERPDKIIIPVNNAKRGHPTLFPVKVLNGIITSSSLRELINGNPEKVLLMDVEDEGTVLDMDTAEDYQKIEGKFRSNNQGRNSP